MHLPQNPAGDFHARFAKNDRDNIGDDELHELRKLSQIFLGLNEAEIASALEIEKMEEITYHDETIQK